MVVKNDFLNNASTIGFRIFLFKEEIGPIIGKSGNNITTIREQTSCSIKFVGPIWKGNRLLIITGNPDGIGAVVTIISKILIEFSSKEKQPDLNNNYEKDNNFTIRLLIPTSQCGPLIGNSGEIIKEIKEKTNTIIKINPKFLPDSSDRICKIIGSPRDIGECCKKIANIFHNNPPKKHHKWFRISEGENSKEKNSKSETTAVFNIKKILTGFLIGKSGCHINQIREFTGARIVVTDGLNGSETRINVDGTAKAVAAASFLIDARLNVIEVDRLKRPIQNKIHPISTKIIESSEEMSTTKNFPNSNSPSYYKRKELPSNITLKKSLKKTLIKEADKINIEQLANTAKVKVISV